MTKKTTPEKTDPQRTAEEIAALYRKKYESTKSVHIDQITAELIEKIRDNFDLGDSLTTRLKNPETRELFAKIGATKRQRLDNGDFSISEINSIAKQHGIALRDSFLKTLGAKIWNKIAKKDNDNSSA